MMRLTLVQKSFSMLPNNIERSFVHILGEGFWEGTFVKFLMLFRKLDSFQIGMPGLSREV